MNTASLPQGGPAAGASAPSLFLDTLFSPQRAMPVIAQRRRTLWVPLLAYLVLFTLLWAWYYQHVDFGWMLEQMVQDTLRRNPGAKADGVRMGLGQMTPGIMTASVVVGGLLMMLAIEFIRALYHHLSARLIEQGDVPLLTWMAVQLWSMLPSVLSLGVSLIYFSVTDVSHLMPQAVSLTSLNALLHLPPDHPYATWAGALDLMLLWTIAITAVACRQLKGVGPVAATLWAAGPFLFIYGAWALAIAS
ncbi:YIP1 family protein [Roseateles terrae]|uniref:Yip1 domain-containing protein n=1 Tax=Roseateles terrae TaxID=431060 RepID=A0ABR6GL97_9BURK|nr:YIP1 family protein [Roseateles terrae]MBB3192873.1 hypothetical protein [Roseateles terrae]OWQ89866.1 hypothetical protein CDN98_05030 [Roseateles terrae]